MMLQILAPREAAILAALRHCLFQPHIRERNLQRNFSCFVWLGIFRERKEVLRYGTVEGGLRPQDVHA